MEMENDSMMEYYFITIKFYDHINEGLEQSMSFAQDFTKESDENLLLELIQAKEKECTLPNVGKGVVTSMQPISESMFRYWNRLYNKG